MNNKKMNNLFAFGKKATLLAMFAAMPFANVKADNGQNVVPEKQELSQTVEVEQNNSKEKKRGSSLSPVLIVLCVADAVYGCLLIVGDATKKCKGPERCLGSYRKSKQR